MRVAAIGEEKSMNDSCNISIVVAVYNTSQYLKNCMDQLVQQTMKPEEYEIIVVNDGSTDQSVAIVRSYMDRYANIRLIDKKNEGTFWCRYDGMMQARGEYIGFVDSDDWVKNEMYETMYHTARREKADIVECRLASGAEAEQGIITLQPGDYRPVEILEYFVNRKLSAALWRRIYKRELITDIVDKFHGMHRELYKGIRNEDEFLFPLLLIRAHKYYVVPEELYHYRVDSNGSIMGEIKADYKKKFYHAGTLLRAGSMLLQDTQTQRRQYQSFFWKMQTENLFYVLGIMKESGCRDGLWEYDFYLQEHRQLGRKKNGTIKKKSFRAIHLYIMWELHKLKRKKEERLCRKE